MLKRLLSGMTAFTLAIGLGAVVPSVSAAGEEGDPVVSATDAADPSGVGLGPNVLVFNDSMSAAEINAAADEVYNQQARNEFGDGRYALLFKPGTYDDGINVKVGYYTQVAGLGQNPDDVNIVGGTVNSDAKLTNGNALTNFWRSIENLSITPKSTDVNDWEKWAVSQAAPMRRVHIKGDLALFDFDSNWGAGYASGGFMADTVVDGTITPASQQQWLSRNDQYGKWSNGVWNMVFVGDTAPPAGDFPEAPYTVVNKTPVMAEKPYLYIDGAGNYNVFVPSLRNDTQGVSWANGAQTPGTSVPLSEFYIAKPGVSDAAAINAALSAGKNVLFTPGKYHLSDTIHVTNPNTIVLGLGLATLIPDNGQVAMQVDDVDGVKVAGLLITAGAIHSSALMEVGQPGSSADHSANPTFLYDVYFGVGGFVEGSADAGLIINSNDVVGDNFWIWRADHGAGAGWDTNPSKNGLIVNGQDVTIYGLFNEHHEEYQTLWNGNGGRVYFYQSEIPYDVQTQDSWMSHGGTVNGFASYKVADSVTDHEAWGLGVYSYFRDAAIALNSAIEVPNVSGVKLHHITTIWLNGTPGSEITHVVNDLGGKVYANSPGDAMRQTVTEYAGGDTQAPSVPSGLSATAVSSSQISLFWTASSDNVGVEGYDVYRNGTKAGSTSTHMTSYTDSGLKAGTTYSYTVVARDTAGNESGVSNAASATTPRELVPYDRSGWTVTASKGENPAGMLDGNNDTRWTTNGAMASGDSFTVDMKTPKRIYRIYLNSGNDYARQYEVYVSNDGESWGEPVAGGTGNNPLIVPQSPVTARYIKVVQTGEESTSWWSVYEFSVFTDSEMSLDRSGWTATSDPASAERTANLFDGNTGTRWSSGTAMMPGQSLIIDLKSEQSFNKIWMDSGTSADYARSFSIYVSHDGENWGDPIVSRVATGPSILVDFDSQTARYIKIVQEGTNSSWWSIYELNVYQEVRNPILVSSVTVLAANGATAITERGGTLQMMAGILPANADNWAVTWSVQSEEGSATDIATISQNGLLTAVKNGTVRVVATAADGSGVSGSKLIEISGQDDDGSESPVLVSSITVSGADGANAITAKGGTLQMSVAVLPVDAANVSVVWAVYNADDSTTDAATISEDGLLTAIKNGAVKVIATAADGSGVSGSALITISGQEDTPETPVLITNIGVMATDGATAITTKGGTLWMNVALLPADATNTSVLWAVYNEDGTVTDKATISADGQLTAVKDGKVKVVATAADGSGVSGSLLITISGQDDDGGTETPVLVTGITVSGTNGATKITTKGGTLQMNAAVLPADATNTSVAWAVYNADDSATDKATISADGLLTAVKDGTVKVVATAADSSGVSGSALIAISGQSQSTPPATVPSNPAPTTDPVSVQAGKAVVQLKVGQEEATIAVSDLQAAGNRTLEIQSDGATVAVPSAVWQQLIVQLPNLQNAVVKISIHSEAAADVKTNDPSLKVGDRVYNLDLSITDKDGHVYRLNGFSEPVQVTLPVDDNDFDPELLGVYVYNETSKQWDYVGGRIDAAGKTITASVPHFSEYAVMAYDKTFADVPSDHWAYQTIRELAAKHIVTGVNADSFDPSGQTTRAQFVEMLVKALGLSASDEAAPFLDVQAADWYAPSVIAAYQAGLITGVNAGEFAPNAPITREQMAALIVRAYEFASGSKSSAADHVAVLKDRDQLSKWAVTDVNKAIELELMQGPSAERFAPQANATRAETAKAILNLLNKASK